MSTPGGVTPGRMGADESTRAPTMQYICGECHQEQEIRPKVSELIWFCYLYKKNLGSGSMPRMWVQNLVQEKN